SASLTLNPPDLGPLEVVLNISNNQATVSFTAAQPEVRQALEDAVPKLREMLGEAGIQLGEANVSAGTPNNQQGRFGDRQQASGGTGDTTDDGENAPVQTVRSQAITGGQGLVDTFA
ncbi:MAG TPA: flagellar hook-length control protein FliK, partial [Nitrosospira sp.]|nr:flagellar hook-length control protein FliK [Nitrosospira sp.]